MTDTNPSRPAHVQLIAIAWNFGWPVVAGVVVGYWIDEKLGSSPVATLTLGLGAMVTAVWRLIDLGKREAVERHELERASGSSEFRASDTPGYRDRRHDGDGNPK